MSLADTKLLITGASGSLGKQLIFESLQRGIKPIAHGRVSSDLSYAESHGLEIRHSDLCQDQDLGELMRGVDVVIHTAAWVNMRRDRLTQFTNINVFGATNLFRAAHKAGVKRFIHISTIAALAALQRPRESWTDRSYKGNLVSEDTPYNLDDFNIPYFMTKRAADVELDSLAPNGTTELVTIHPSIIVAPSRTGDDRRKARKRFGKYVVPDIGNRFNLVDIRDVAKGVINAIELGRPGDHYILSGENISGRDLCLEISSQLGWTPHLLGIPRSILMGLAHLAVFFARLRGKSKISFYPDLVRMLDYDWAYSSRKARRQLDYSYRPLQTTLGDLLTNKFHGTYMKP